MPKLAYFITNHGFGHVTRSIAVIQALSRQIPDLELAIVSRPPSWFFEEIQGAKHVHLDYDLDPGLPQVNALTLDDKNSLEKLAESYPAKQERIAPVIEELSRFRPDLILSDIVPLAFLIAERLQVPSILLENFTWVEILKHLQPNLPGVEPFVNEIEGLYAKKSLHLQMRPYLLPGEDALALSPIARIPDPGRGIKEELGIENKMLLYSFGGFGPLEDLPHGFQEQEEFTLVQPCAVKLVQREGNLIRVPGGGAFRHPDLVEAADVMIGKLGYSTVAEAYFSQTPLLYLARPGFIESVVLERFLLQEGRGRFLNLEDLRNDAWHRFSLEEAARPKRIISGQRGQWELAKILREKLIEIG